MHEWALAEAVLSSVSEIVGREQLDEVTEINISIGELQDVEREIFKFALNQMKPARFEKTRFRITRAKTRLKCRNCGNEWQLKNQKINATQREAIHFIPEVAHTYIKCPRCASPDFEITQGRGIWIRNIKGTRKT